MSTAVPLTPKKSKEDNINLKINAVVSSLSREWDLQFVLPLPGDSPSRRLNQTLAEKCVFKIKALTFKNAIDSVLEDFYSQANILYSRWVHKPKGHRGTVPEKTRYKPHPVSDKERVELQHLFYTIADREFTLIMGQERGTPLSERRRLRSDDKHIAVDRSGFSEELLFNDRPIPSKLPPSTRKSSMKRAAETAHDQSKTFKRPPKLGSKSELDGVFRASFSTSTESERTKTPSHDSNTIRSINNSFTSYAPSVFDTSFSRGGGLSDVFSTTQVTEPNDQASECQIDYSTNILNTEKQHHSSEFGSSFDAELVEMADSFHSVPDPLETGSDKTEASDAVFEDAVDVMVHEDDAKTKERKGDLRNSLEGIFPVMPDCLLSMPLHVRYEIIRVFNHAGASLDGLVLPDFPQWDNYDIFWAFLRTIPVLQNYPFPERSSRQAWEACQDEFRRGSRGVSMSGSLRYRPSASTGPLFRFQLEPLRLEQTYRLQRRFGNDRFLEIDVPNLTGRCVPKILKRCPNGKSIVIEWLFQDMHPLFGRSWAPFCTKPKEGKERKADTMEQQSDIDDGLAHRIYFFAVHGIGFGDNCGTPKEAETVETRTAMSVESLLNWIRSTWENRDQSYLKLFARTTLTLSRNTPTVVLNRSQIRYMRDLKCNKEIMTDGAGRLSSALALRIVHILGLSHLPSGFQGRIGDAKGLWSIDPRYHGEEEWIEIYDSQRKWKRSGKLDDLDFKDPAHRTFEVNKCSGKLKPADLNLQLLPILDDRANSKPAMYKAIAQLVKDDLGERIESQRLAMENPLSFRKWVREANPRLGDRVKHGAVPFVAAMPDSMEEKLNMFVDAGFDPLKLKYLNDLSKKYYDQKCEELKKQLHITVPRSTYAFMVPDFAGVLEVDEIFIHISESFVDELSPLSGCPFQGMDVLVARSPAHYASDIQRVRAVVKEELLGLKDVVVFPTKGNRSLADKLSGGDYDGDLAWICWEPSIVTKFVNANVPHIPDLVKEGFISKDRTTYEELVNGEADPTTTFLSRSFEFNLENSMLGICTSFKENLCYTQQRIDSKEAVYLSTLLSNLVDHAKQGYIFTEVEWNSFRKALIKQIPRQPLYKSGILDEKSTYIIDRLKFVANSTVEKILTNFHRMTSKPEYWDSDLVTYYDWAQKEGLVHPEWLGILKNLKMELGKVGAEWNRLVLQEGGKTDEPFASAATKCYERFQAIQPDGNTPLTRTLIEEWHQNPGMSRWALLRASCAFAMYSKKSFVWWMAGIQLCHIKSIKMGGVISMVPQMYAMLKPDNTFVKLRLSEEMVYQWEDENAEDMEGRRWG